MKTMPFAKTYCTGCPKLRKTKRKQHVNFFELETEVLLYSSIWLFS